jgi:hypothetical protein
MKLSNDGINWLYEIRSLGEQSEVYRVRIGVGWGGFFFDLQPDPHEWWYIAEIVPVGGAGLYRWQVFKKKRNFFNKLFEKLKENQDGGTGDEIVF